MNTMKGVEVRAQKNDYGRNIGIRIARENGDGSLSAVQELVFAPVDEFAFSLPSFTLSPEQAQLLMDELWNCGLRPTEGSGSAGSLAATQEHLKDMRTIAFSLLDGEQVLARVARDNGATKP